MMRLTELGYDVLEADSGQAALDILADGRHVDLLFTDIVMPGGLGGLELAERARGLDPDLKMLFTSGYADAGADDRRFLERNVRLLRKPYKTADLARKVREALDG